MFTISLFWAVAIVCRRRSLDEKIIIYLCFFCFSFLFLRIVFSTLYYDKNEINHLINLNFSRIVN